MGPGEAGFPWQPTAVCEEPHWHVGGEAYDDLALLLAERLRDGTDRPIRPALLNAGSVPGYAGVPRRAKWRLRMLEAFLAEENGGSGPDRRYLRGRTDCQDSRVS